MTEKPSDGNGSTSDLEALAREEVADQPDATIVEMWEPDDYGVFVVVERPGPENQPLQTLYRVTLEPIPESGDQLNWAWLGPYTED